MTHVTQSRLCYVDCFSKEGISVTPVSIPMYYVVAVRAEEYIELDRGGLVLCGTLTVQAHLEGGGGKSCDCHVISV